MLALRTHKSPREAVSEKRSKTETLNAGTCKRVAAGTPVEFQGRITVSKQLWAICQNQY